MKGDRAVIYDRTSIKDDASMGEHLKRCRAWCESQGLEVTAEQTDRGISGFHDKVRPGWTEVKRMVEADEVDVVVFFALSRIERSIIRTFQFAELCREHDVAFVSVTEEINTGGPWGRVILAVLSAAAEIESLTKSERSRMGRDRNEREGFWSGGYAGFGFRAIEDGGRKRLEVDAKAAGLIRDAAKRILNGKAGVTTGEVEVKEPFRATQTLPTIREFERG